MAVAVTHTKVSAIADDPAASAAGEVLPSDWNSTHSVSGLGTAAELASDTDPTLAADSDSRIATQKAVRTFVAASVVAGQSNVFIFQGFIDATGGTNYPAADRGHVYVINTAGKIGGASGLDVVAGVTLYCLSDDTPAGTQEDVGLYWTLVPAFDVDINAIAGLTSAANKGIQFTGSGTAATYDLTTAGKALLDDADAAAQRTTLGLAAVAASGSASDLGTGTLPIARIADAAVTYAKIQNISATDKLLGRSSSGAGVTEEIACTAAGRALIDDADAAAQRTTLGLVAIASSGSASDLSTGTVAAARMPALTGDATTSAGAVATTLATVNSNVGSFTNANITVNGKGLVTAAANGTAGGASGGHVINARLTLTTATPVTTADVTGATSIYWTPFRGNTVTLWDGSAWTQYTLTEVTLALGTITNARPYDVFGYQNAGTPAAEILAWTSDTARATAVTLQDGRYAKSGDKTRLYLGTFRTTSTTTTEDSGGGTTTQVGGKRFLWNYYNRVARFNAVIDTTATWSYTTDTIRQANGAAGNKVEFLVGMDEDATVASLVACANLQTNARGAKVGIGLDSTTAFAKFAGYGLSTDAVNPVFSPMSVPYSAYVGVGYHYLAWLERGADVNCVFQGGAASSQAGLTATTLA